MEFILGVSLMLAGIFIMARASGFPTLPGGYPGPGLFPQILGFLLASCGLLVIAIKWREKAWPRLPRLFPIRREVLSFVLVIVAVLVYVLFSESLGFILVTSLIMVGLMLSLGVPFRMSLPVGLGVTFLAYLIFRKLLAVPLPGGLLGSWV